MMTRDECIARAVELERLMLITPVPSLQEGYGHLASQWRILADVAAYEAAKPGKVEEFAR